MTNKDKEKIAIIACKFTPKNNEYHAFLKRESENLAACYLYACGFHIGFNLEYFKGKDVTTSQIITKFLTDNGFSVRDLGTDCDIVFNRTYTVCLNYGIAIHFEAVSNKGISINAPISSIDTSLGKFVVAMGNDYELSHFKKIHAKVFYRNEINIDKFLSFE